MNCKCNSNVDDGMLMNRLLFVSACKGIEGLRVDSH